MKTNVLHIIDSLKTGGAETIAVNTVNALNQTSSVNAYLCATREEGPLKNTLDNHSRYIFLNKKRTFDGNALKVLKNFIQENNIDIIHAHSTSFFIAYLIKLRVKNVKVIWHNHSGANTKLGSGRLWIVKICVKTFAAIINVNDALNDWAQRELKFSNSIKLDNFVNLDIGLKKTQLIGDTKTKIVCVAGFRQEKDHLNLLKAFKLLLNKNSDLSLHLIGNRYNDNYEASLLKFIQDNDLIDNVFIYGNRPDVFHILTQADIGILSSKSEGLPLSLLEYGLAKLPVVVTNVGDCSNVVENNSSGLIVEKENDNALAQAIQSLLIDRDKATTFGENLYQTVKKKYSVEKYIDKLISIYSTL